MTISVLSVSVRRPSANFAFLEVLRIIRNHLSYAFRLSNLIEELFKLSDGQLKKIGTERNKIWGYAEELIQRENEQ